MCEWASEAVERNFTILKKYNFNLAKKIEAQKSLPVGYGSEFWPPQTLKKIFMNHSLWNRMESLLKEGSKWPLMELSKRDRTKDLNKALQFGNHN